MRNFILGTDWGADCDDVVALRILARAHKNGNCCLKAIGINDCCACSARSADAFLHAHGVDDVAIGIDRTAVGFHNDPYAYQPKLALLPSKISSNEQAEDAVRLYRRILIESIEPIEIMEIGFLQVLAAVLRSGPDDLSPQSGEELVRDKVTKIWIMAGKLDEPNGWEYNFACNSIACEASAYVCAHCPVPITFLGFEVGVDVISGAKLAETDILHKAMCDHGSPHGRSSWDPMLVTLALIGDETEAGYDIVCGTASVDPQDGRNNFVPHADGKHKYVIKRMPNEYYQDTIDRLIASEEQPTG